MSTESRRKEPSKKLKIAFSAVCLSIIAVGAVVYFSTAGTSDVAEPTTIAETTTEVQRAVTVKETTTAAPSTTAAETTKPQAEDTSMRQSEENTPYKGSYEYPLGESMLQGFSRQPVKNETMGDYRSHTAVDFSGEAGSAVNAVNDGLVMDVYNDPLLGLTVQIDHGGKLVAYYCGMDSVSVKAGGRVDRGQQIGTLGKVPFEASLESHLHFETRLDGEYVDPLSVMGKTE